MSKAAEGTNDVNRNDRATSLDRYLRMDEREKDAEIQKAIMRLQRRIQEILYVLESQNQVMPELQPGENNHEPQNKNPSGYSAQKGMRDAS